MASRVRAGRIFIAASSRFRGRINTGRNPQGDLDNEKGSRPGRITGEQDQIGNVVQFAAAFAACALPFRRHSRGAGPIGRNVLRICRLQSPRPSRQLVRWKISVVPLDWDTRILDRMLSQLVQIPSLDRRVNADSVGVSGRIAHSYRAVHQTEGCPFAWRQRGLSDPARECRRGPLLREI